jgi:hypothetical protein
MIIGLIGFAGSGKGTVGDYLMENGFYVDSFARPLKDAASVIFGWDREMLEGDTKESREWREKPDKFWSDSLGYEFTPRMAIQRLGTEAGQYVFGKQLWVASLFKRIAPYKDVVITDARFTHEIKAIEKEGGLLIRIKRGPEPEWYDTLLNLWTDKDREEYMKQFNIHKSEWDWVGCGHFYIINDGDIPSLYQKVDDMVNKFREQGF